MAKKHILRIGEDGNPVSLYTYDAQNQSCTIASSQQWSDPRLAESELVLLLPASWVYHSQTSVASKNLELLNKSIPFAIEEELSNEVEDNYFAFKLNADGSQSVVAIERTHLDQISRSIKTHDLRIEAIHSEVDWLPVKSQVVSVWRDENTSLIRLGKDQAMRVANHQVSQLLPVFAQQMKQVICNDPVDLGDIDLPVKSVLEAGHCCAHLLQSEAVDLYVDALKAPSDAKESNPWKTVIALGLVLVLSWVGIQAIQWYSLTTSIAQLKQQQADLFQNQYSDAAATELLDPFAALQSRLQLQNTQAGSGKDILLDAVEYLGQATRQQQLVQLNGLRLVDEKLEFQVTAANMTAINDFHQSLQQHAYDYQVQIGVNELADDNTFKSILTMVPR